MGEQLGVTAKIDGKNPVARHWALQLFTDEAGLTKLLMGHLTVSKGLSLKT